MIELELRSIGVDGIQCDMKACFGVLGVRSEDLVSQSVV